GNLLETTWWCVRFSAQSVAARNASSYPGPFLRTNGNACERPFKPANFLFRLNTAIARPALLKPAHRSLLAEQFSCCTHIRIYSRLLRAWPFRFRTECRQGEPPWQPTWRRRSMLFGTQDAAQPIGS